jgi:Holliday junction DNA helicase RuvB
MWCTPPRHRAPNLSSVAPPLQASFGLACEVPPYSEDELVLLLHRSARLLGVVLDEAAAATIADGSGGSMRIADHLLRRARDYAQVRGTGTISEEVASAALGLHPPGDYRPSAGGGQRAHG